MKRHYYQWHSQHLDRNMELLVFGHAGARVVVFPTSQGRFYQWEDQGMIATLSSLIENGMIQLYCVDSIDSESWYCFSLLPTSRASRHDDYDRYLYHELLPFSEEQNDNPFVISLGASFGGYHAMTFGLKHPDKVNRILAMSGLFDIRRFTDGDDSGAIYFNNPIEFIPNEYDAARLEQLYCQDIIMATGQGDQLIHTARELSGVLWRKGIGNALREWDGWAHDWPYWKQMVQLYIGGHD